MTFILPELPFKNDALAPHISSETLSYHYGKHHKTYVDNLNKLVDGSPLADKTLEEIIAITSTQPDKLGVFNNAAQVWNHAFYWHCMSSNGGGKPSNTLLTVIEDSFGNFEDFIEEFSQAAITCFGSGWAWLVQNEERKLQIIKTSNASTPIIESNLKPLCTIDVWEHAYYIDYKNARPKYVETFFSKLVNWAFVEENLSNKKIWTCY